MAKIIDLAAERRKRRIPSGPCSMCGYVYSIHDLTMIPDDAELYILCEKCAEKMEAMEKKRCPDCHREVYYFHEVDGREVCGICHKLSQQPSSANREDEDPTVLF